MEDSEFDVMARVYDMMIPWEARLKREMSFIISTLKPAKRVLEVACSTGRHTAELAKEFEVVGVDINAKMIEIANENLRGMDNIRLVHGNILDQTVENLGKFDGGIILANTLANMENQQGVIRCLEKLRVLIPDGKLVGQTVLLGNEVVYLPLRSCTMEGDEYLIQRIMIPLSLNGSTHQLHFNVFRNGEYFSKSIHPIYSISPSILKNLANKTGWKVKELYGGYDKKEPVEEFGSAHVWVLE